MSAVDTGRKGRLREVLSALALLLIVVLASSICVPAFRPAKARARLRACFANQKTLAGAIEMYNLDNKTRPWAEGPHRLGVEEQGLLVKAGYLQALMTDPLPGLAVSPDNYLLLDPSPRLMCLLHGRLDGTGSAREQLLAERVSDEPLLSAASELPMDWEPPDHLALNLFAWLITEMFCHLLTPGGRPGRLTVWTGRAGLLAALASRQYNATAPVLYTLSSGFLGVVSAVSLVLLAIDLLPVRQRGNGG